MAKTKESSKSGPKKNKGKPPAHLKLHLPPMKDIETIFSDLTAKAIVLGLPKFLRHQGDRPLKIATLCSGTETPILALKRVNEALEDQNSPSFDIDHLFSAEIEPYKQAYIQRNFKPPILFRDVVELDQEKAYTAYGALEQVPGGVDLLIAGSSCVDYSNLSNAKPENGGESEKTFDAAIAYAKKHGSRIVVMENVQGAPRPAMEAAWAEAGYDAFSTILDSKDYYLPQTRQRVYLVALEKNLVKAAGLDPKKLGIEWEDLMESFRRPASSDASEFLFDEDDECVQDERKDLLRAPRKRGSVAWILSQARYVDFRINKRLGSKRPYTNWRKGGFHKAPDYWWKPWLKRLPDRILDCLEMNYLLGIDKGWDMSYVARFLDLSQNIDREQHERVPGIVGCITPSGIPCSTTRGGPILGKEALNLQGLPVREMLFTRETSNQLKDLAGNAMSCPVVGAAMLSALIVAHQILPKGEQQKDVLVKEPETKTTLFGEHQFKPHTVFLNPGALEETPVHELMGYVVRATRLCACEGSTSLKSKSSVFLQCRQCLHTVCKSCFSNPIHDFEEMDKRITGERMSYAQCRDKIQKALPMRLRLGAPNDWETSIVNDSDWEAAQDYARRYLGEELRFHSVKRGLKWTVRYQGDHGRLELSIAAQGVQWLYFADVPELEPVNSKLREILSQPFARMLPRDGSILNGVWEFNEAASKAFNVTIAGSLDGTQIDCLQLRLGLEDDRYQGRKVWKKLLIVCSRAVEQDLGTSISGEFVYLEHCGTAMNSLYRQISLGDGLAVNKEQAVFLFFDQDEVGTFDTDSFVFANDHRGRNRGNSRPVLARVDKIIDMPVGGESNLLEDRNFDMYKVPGDYTPLHVGCNSSGRWRKCEKASLTATVGGHAPQCSVLLSDPVPVVDIGSGLCASSYVPLLECSASVDSTNLKPTIEASTWLTERTRRLPPSNQWNPTAPPPSFEKCETCAPSKASLVWRPDEEGILMPYENEIETGEFERKHKARPRPLIAKAQSVEIGEENGTQVQISLNVATMLHRAMASLPRITVSEKDHVSCSWRLVTDVTPIYSPPVATFSIPSNKDTDPFRGPYGFENGKTLRPEQLRELSWAFAMDQKGAIFAEQEVEEAHLGSMGWRAEGLVTVQRTHYGGVLADNVGFGKTAIILALIGATRKAKDLDQTLPQDIEGAIRIKATLILVPPNLINQWSKETYLFLGDGITCLCVPTDKAWAKLTVREIEAADIVLVSWKLLLMQTADKLLKKVQTFTSHPPPPLGNNDRAKTQWFAKAMYGMEESIEVVKNGDLAQLSKQLNAKLSEPQEIGEAFAPSKRFKGKEYQKKFASASTPSTDPVSPPANDMILASTSSADPVSSSTRDTAWLSPADVPSTSAITSSSTSATASSSTSSTTSKSTKPSKSTDNYEQMRKAELMTICKQKNVLYTTRTSKKDLITAIRNHELKKLDKDRVNPTAAIESPQQCEMTDTPMPDAPGVIASTAEVRDSHFKDQADSFSKADYIKKTIPELKDEIKKRGLKGYSKKNKSQLIQMLLENNSRHGGKRTVSEAFECDDADAQMLFGIYDDMEMSERGNMRNPPIHMFFWDRVVVDEFQYLAKKYGCLIPFLKARSRFILSATPALQTFADVRLLATLLGIHLGVEDEDDLVGSSTENPPTLSTAVEKFVSSYSERHSRAWNGQRIELAQRFLSRSARKNDPEHDEIKREEHMIAGNLTSSQLPIYLELQQQLATQDLDMPLKKLPSSAIENDRLRRINDLIGKHDTAQRALMHAASDFNESSGVTIADPTQACQEVIQSRKSQMEECAGALEKMFTKAVWLSGLTYVETASNKPAPGDQRESFENFKKMLKEGRTWDGPVVFELQNLLQNAELKTSESDGALFYQTEAERKAVEAAKKEVKDETKKDGAKKKKSSTKTTTSKTKKMVRFEIRNLFPASADAICRELSNVTAALNTLSDEYESLMRGHRFFEHVGICQDWMAKGGNRSLCTTCSTLALPNSTNIFVTCGHILCQSCVEKASEDTGHGTCPVGGCISLVNESEIVKAAALGGNCDPLDGKYGSKIGNLLRLLKGDTSGDSKIEAGHQALLFVQSNIMKTKIVAALKTEALSHAVLDAKAGGIHPFLNYQPATPGSEGQVAKAEAGAKILVLEVDNEKAAGLNLTKARHVVFFAPLLSDSQPHYEAQMKQAIGRACRYGQMNVVHIHRLVSLNTIEVNVLEQREAKTLVQRNEEFLLAGQSERGDVGGWNVKLLGLEDGEVTELDELE